MKPFLVLGLAVVIGGWGILPLQAQERPASPSQPTGNSPSANLQGLQMSTEQSGKPLRGANELQGISSSIQVDRSQVNKPASPLEAPAPAGMTKMSLPVQRF